MLAFDCSNYSGYITVEQANAAYAAGYRRAIVQIIDPPPGYPQTAWRWQIPILLAAGFEVEAYTYLYLRDNPTARVQWALDQMAKFKDVTRLWLDIEDTDDADVSLADKQWEIWRCIEMVQQAGRRVGIYTAAWWWNSYMPGVDWVASYAPLWAAYYDGGKDLIMVPFGGWNNPEMKQFAGTSAIGDIQQVDLNYYT